MVRTGKSTRAGMVAALLLICVSLSSLPAPVALQLGSPASAQEDSSRLMLDEPVSELPVVDDARWSERWTGSSGPAVIVWMLFLAVLLVIGYPWARLLFPGAADAGIGFARLVSLMIPAYAIWVLASIEVLEFKAVWTVLSLGTFGAAGWLLWSRRSLTTSASPIDRRPTIANELVFWTVFGLFLIFRLVNPDSWHPIWGGEKPMEFAHINAILRSAHFPPYDPWFAGGLLNYYYYGEYLVAFAFKATGIPSEIAFNLAQPTIMAILATGVFSVVSTLTNRLSLTTTRPALSGAIGVVVVVLMGNLVALRELVAGLPAIPQPDFVDWTWAGSRAITGGITEFPYFTGLYADLHAHVIALPVTVLVVALCLDLTSPLPQNNSGSDSPGRFAQPIAQLLMMALALGTLSAANAWDVPVYALFVLAAIVMASFSIEPLYRRIASVGIAAVGTFGLAYLLFKPFHDAFVPLYSDLDRVRSGTDLNEFAVHVGGLLLIIGFGSWFLAKSFRPGRLMGQNVIQHAVFAVGAACVAGIVVIVAEVPRQHAHTIDSVLVMTAAMLLTLTVLYLRFGPGALGMLVTTTIVIVATLAAMRGWSVLGLALAFGIVGTIWWLTAARKGEQFFGLLIAAGSFTATGVEVVYVVDDLQSLEIWYRMNTLFKLYNQVWMLLSIAAAVVTALVLQSVTTSRARISEITDQPATLPFDVVKPSRRIPLITTSQLATVVSVVAGAVIAASLLYPLLATKPRLELRFGGNPGAFATLDAIDWMRYGAIVSESGETIRFDGDLAAIQWFNEEVLGTPVIAEASIGPYRGNGSRISIATGLPAVIGWNRHERQQRYPEDVIQRSADIRELYSTPDTDRKSELIDQYDVSYIVVGDIERETISPDGLPYASPDGIAAFTSMLGSSLEIAFESDSTIVYRVLEEFSNVSP